MLRTRIARVKPSPLKLTQPDEECSSFVPKLVRRQRGQRIELGPDRDRKPLERLAMVAVRAALGFIDDAVNDAER